MTRESFLSGPRYLPSPIDGWFTLVTRGKALTIQIDEPNNVLELWEQLEQEKSPQGILEFLTRNGISKSPSFALVYYELDSDSMPSAIEVIVRGEINVIADGKECKETITGSGVSSWVERKLGGVTGIRISLNSFDSSKSQEDDFLPLEIGVARTAEFELGAIRSAKHDLPRNSVEVDQTIVAFDEAIDLQPDFTEVDTEANLQEEVVTSDVSDSADSGYDYLFGETVARSVEGAAMRNLDSPSEVAESNRKRDPKSLAGGDHDGQTVVGLDRATKRAARQARLSNSDGSSTTGSQFWLEFTSGQNCSLDRPVLIGRAPSASQVSGDNLPQLITVTAIDQDISRTHVRVQLEGGTVVVTDLHSSNGTRVILPGKPPLQIRAGEPTPVITGTVIELGTGVSFSVKER